MDVVASALVPFGSVFVGAAITYWVNVLQRRRTKVEDVLHRAIGEVAKMSASRDFFTGLSPSVAEWSEEQGRALSAELTATALRQYAQAVALARAAVAEASVYFPDLGPLLRLGGAEFADEADRIVAQLRSHV
ncbi:MAG TPA: hypothetical protein P5193_00985 [Microthrixaceae bacterium]|nr:hypothetical protein [Microthrixaceae bacterium]